MRNCASEVGREAGSGGQGAGVRVKARSTAAAGEHRGLVVCGIPHSSWTRISHERVAVRGLLCGHDGKGPHVQNNKVHTPTT